MNHDHLRTLELAARYVSILGQVEQAHARDWQEEVESLLAGVDPIDCRYVARELANLRRDEIGATDALPVPARTTVAPVASIEHWRAVAERVARKWGLA